MAYITLAQIKDHLDINSDTDDVLLSRLIETAQQVIDDKCGQSFEAETATRYYERSALSDDGFSLILDAPLLTVTTLTNGDSSATVIPATEYWLMPRNETPKHSIRLKIDSTYSWEFDTDYWVSVLGTWGKMATANAAIQEATKQLVSYYYALKDSQTFDVTAVPEAGIITVPQGFPRSVEKILIDGGYLRMGMA